MSKTTPTKKCLTSQIEPQFTTAPIEAWKAAPTTQPIWISLPAQGKKCPHTSLCKSTLNSLILGPNPPVHSVSLRKPHAIRGKRLILLSSLLEYLDGLAAAQNPTASEPAFVGTERVDNTKKPDRQRGKETQKTRRSVKKPKAKKQ